MKQNKKIEFKKIPMFGLGLVSFLLFGVIGTVFYIILLGVIDYILHLEKTKLQKGLLIFMSVCGFFIINFVIKLILYYIFS